MPKHKLSILSGLVGVILGYISAHTFFASSWTALIPWGLIGLILGYTALNRKEVFIPGVLYGFFLTFSFLVFGFHGANDKFASFLLFSLILSLVGALGGSVLFVIGITLKSKVGTHS